MTGSTPEPIAPGTDPSLPEDPNLIKSLRRRGSERVVFGRFRLLRELGSGGMAVVWLARDERLGLEVALKFLPGMVASDPEALHDLRREITKGLRLTHTGIVRVYDLHEDPAEGLAAIGMEYMDGATLAEEKARQPSRRFEVAEPLLSWTRTLCDVLTYVHEEARVVHRDLKPRNLMLTSAGKLKVADFGVAATLCDSQSRLTQHPGSSGTPVYMSPQQAMGSTPKAADDLYALGATLYELLTSKPPFFRGNMAIILNQVASLVPPSVRERREELGAGDGLPIPPEWEETIAACLAKQPADRPASAREVARRLGLGPSFAESPPRSTSPPGAAMPAMVRPLQPEPSRASPAASRAVSPDAEWLGGPPPLPLARPRSARRFGAAGWGLTLLILVLAAWGASQLWQPGVPSVPEGRIVQPTPSPAVAVTVPPAPPPVTTPPKPLATPDPVARASKADPFVNSLGLEFVPVPGTRILMCRTDTRVRDFRAYTEETGYRQTSGAFVMKVKKGDKGAYSTSWDFDANASWESPGFEQAGDHPAVCVSWEEARAFCDWLSRKEGRQYRLPKDTEWTAAVGVGKYPWGNAWPPPKDAGNFFDVTLAKKLSGSGWTIVAEGYDDGAAYTSPVGRYPENRLGLYDMGGNVLQWCDDEYRADMNDAEALEAFPTLKKERDSDGTAYRVQRGGCWGQSNELGLRSAYRANGHHSNRSAYKGFRCVLVLPGG